MGAFSIFILTLFVISTNCMQRQLGQELDTSIPPCIKENNINSSTLEVDPRRFPEDEKTKCFIKCVAVRIGIMTEGGQFQLKDFLAKTQLSFEEENDHAITIMEKCDKTEASLDACETAFVAFKCFLDGVCKRRQC